MLQSIFSPHLSYAEMAAQMNARLGTNYTRCAIIGRARRLLLANPTPPRKPSKSNGRKEYYRQIGIQRRMARWAAKPELREHYERKLARDLQADNEQVRTEGRKRAIAHGHSKTSAGYRKFMPRLPEMSKAEMRAMLTGIVQNTAALEVT